MQKMQEGGIARSKPNLLFCFLFVFFFKKNNIYLFLPLSPIDIGRRKIITFNGDVNQLKREWHGLKKIV
jgi:hypothetical protein